MDAYCRNCGEPVELDYFHDVADDQGTTFSDVYTRFIEVGCAALGENCQPPHSRVKPSGGLAFADDLDEMISILGDDVDGFVATMEDVWTSGLRDSPRCSVMSCEHFQMPGPNDHGTIYLCDQHKR